MNAPWASLSAIVLALCLSGILLFIHPIHRFLVESTESEEVMAFPAWSSKYLTNFETGLQAELDLRFSLANPNCITIIGSSELGGKDSANVKSFNFIPLHSSFSAMGYGHAGNQNLAIMQALLGNTDVLEDAKVVILISPSWFTGDYAKGTSLKSFLEFSTQRSRSKMLNESRVPLKYVQYIGAYIHDNYENISGPGADIDRIRDAALTDSSHHSGLPYLPIEWAEKKWDEFVIEYTDPLWMFNGKLQELKFATEANPTAPHSPNWDSLYLVAENRQRSISSNNTWGIENHYYTTYSQGKKWSQKIVDPPANKELKDFMMLLDMFKHYKVRALFVIQPLNPYAYENLDGLKTFMDGVNDSIEQAGFPVLNMFVVDSTEYRIGTLADAMHLGNLGWYQIDRFILEQYVSR